MTRDMIADLPLEERPRERLLRHGPATLSDSELVAILLGSGVRGRSAVHVAREITARGLHELSRCDWGSEHVIGVGDAKAARLAAAFEIARRLAAHRPEERMPVRDAESIARSLIARYSHHLQERLGAVFLDSKNRVLKEREIYVGTLNSTVVSTRDVIRLALQESAAAVIIFHNHPSGDPAPSAEDIVFTRKMIEAGKLMGVDVMDHLILGTNRYVSLRKRGMF
ncbi:MAG: DNA repair protein RadC [Thermoanaerobaculia bacterium]